MKAQALNSRGEWVPAIPIALGVWFWHRCECGRNFFTREGYRGHYALSHILALGHRLERPHEIRVSSV